jgi:A/G-specific adenine glycosylase
MLQQTQVRQVELYYHRFMDLFPDIPALAGVPLERVLKAWEGMGYYSRARYLHQTAKIIVHRFGGVIPERYEDLLKLPGIGRSTAGAILSLAYGKSFPVMDGNIQRVLVRFFYIEKNPRKGDARQALWSLSAQILPEKNAGPFNEAMMELGALICTPQNPDCPHCPIQMNCQAFHSGRPADLPVKAPRRQRPYFDVTAAVIRKKKKILITRRPEKGLLGGLWEFPGGKKEAGESLEDCLKREIREELNIDIEIGDLFIQIPHAYTHFRITLHCFFCRQLKGKITPLGVEDYRWVYPGELKHFPFPKADQKVIDYLLQKPQAPAKQAKDKKDPGARS